MTDNRFDDSLKNMIRDHGSPVPHDMWERIIQKKDKDKKGFLFFFRWFTVLMLGVCLGGYLLMNHTKQKPEPANQVLSNQDQQTSQAPTHLNKDEVVQGKNPSPAVQHLLMGYRGSYSSKTIRESKENAGDNGRFGGIKTVAKQTENGVQNSSLQKDSLSEEKSESETNKPEAGINPEAINKQPAIVKPALKSPVDSLQKSVVKKMLQDSVAEKKWYLDIYASPDWPIDNTAYTSSNFFNEQMKLSYTVGLRVNRTLGKHFSVKSGIQFSQINFTIIDSGFNGAVNHLKSFDLPVLLGYSFGAEKLKMTITAGGIANLSSSYTGDPYGNVFKTNTGFSFYLGFNLERKINQKISVYLEPYYRYRLTSMTVSTVEYNKFIDIVGLSFGARYYFLKSAKK